MLCQYTIEEERGDVDTAETVECGVHSAGRLGRGPRAQDGQRVRQYIRGASPPEHPLETSAPKRGARQFLSTTRQATARPGSIPSAVVSANRATQGRVGLTEKNSWTCHLRHSARGLKRRIRSSALRDNVTAWGCHGHPPIPIPRGRVQSI